MLHRTKKIAKVQTESDPAFVACRLCGKHLRIIQTQHLVTHGISREEYMEKFNLSSDKLVCTDRRVLISRRSDYVPLSQEEVHAKLREVLSKPGDVFPEFSSTRWPMPYMQAIQIHGTWREALRAAGVETWRMERDRLWSAERVTRELRANFQKNGHLQYVVGKYGPLPWYAKKYFGSWAEAVKQAGFSEEQAGSRQTWTREKVASLVRARQRRSDFTDKEFLSFVGAARRHYGSVENVLKAEGLAWSDFYGTRRWSREIVIRELKQYRRKYGKYCSTIAYKDNPVVNLMAVKYVGSWNEALRLAGIEPGKRPWTKDTLCQEVRKILRDGALPTNAAFIQRKSGKIYVAGIKLFGSWKATLEAAGLEFKRATPQINEALAQILKSKGGRLVSGSGEPLTASNRVRVACAKGHAWNTLAKNILAGKWCAACANGERPLIAARQLAEKLDGECLTQAYLNCTEKLEWKCKRGHVWMQMLARVKMGIWCQECVGVEREEAKLTSLSDAISRRGGKILSYGNLDNTTKHHFECEFGHKFSTTFKSIVKDGHWCRTCKHKNMMKSVQDMQALAAKKGGKFLSLQYAGINVKHDWECHQGHQFSSRPVSVTVGYWCPDCAGTKRLTIEEMREIAASRGGKCLSEIYINGLSDLVWQCDQGHTWNAPGQAVKQSDSWCPVCAGNFKGTIEKMQAFAATHGGHCRSTEYKGNKAPLKWECARGHTWEEGYNVLSRPKQRGWCRECYRVENQGSKIDGRLVKIHNPRKTESGVGLR